MAGKNGQSREDLLITAIARGESFVRSAKMSGISERTARRRMSDEGFRRQVQEARATMVQEASGRMAHAMNEAALTLQHLLTAESESVRLASARSILEHAIRLRETVELEQRISGLEAKLDDKQPQKPIELG